MCKNSFEISNSRRLVSREIVLMIAFVMDEIFSPSYSFSCLFSKSTYKWYENSTHKLLWQIERHVGSIALSLQILVIHSGFFIKKKKTLFVLSNVSMYAILDSASCDHYYMSNWVPIIYVHVGTPVFYFVPINLLGCWAQISKRMKKHVSKHEQIVYKL